MLGGSALDRQAVVTTLGLREEPGRPLLTLLTGHLHARRLLPALGNCEHRLASCAESAAVLLPGCPHLQLPATSRERLSIGGEMSYRAPSLALPAPGQQVTPVALGAYEGVRLFVERARACRPCRIPVPDRHRRRDFGSDVGSGVVDFWW